ncbi:hypothetical protein BOO35_19290, partial [Vibrio navarrensis]|uniref:hypothetical protein n=1 Tax=Vibrio navarrensis TaxID=29495 RepID=UPI001D03DE68
TICQTSGKERAPGAARISAGLNKGPLLGGSHKATFFRRWFFTFIGRCMDDYNKAKNTSSNRNKSGKKLG